MLEGDSLHAGAEVSRGGGPESCHCALVLLLARALPGGLWPGFVVAWAARCAPLGLCACLLYKQLGRNHRGRHVPNTLADE